MFALCLAPVPAAAQAPPGPVGIKIQVLEGDGAINNVRQRKSREPLVRVVDDDNQPVRGATVTFVLPDRGPGGEFAGDVRELAIVTDEKGQAVGRGLMPNQQVGKYQIRVVASYRGERVEAVINQMNAEPAGSGGAVHSKKILLIAVIGGAAAAGLALAVGHGGSSSPSTSSQPTGSGTPVGIVISGGTPVFQNPH